MQNKRAKRGILLITLLSLVHFYRYQYLTLLLWSLKEPLSAMLSELLLLLLEALTISLTKLKPVEIQIKKSDHEYKYDTIWKERKQACGLKNVKLIKSSEHILTNYKAFIPSSLLSRTCPVSVERHVCSLREPFLTCPLCCLKKCLEYHIINYHITF